MIFLRLPIIRHIRYFYHCYRLNQWVESCARMGLGMGYANESDIATLDAIWRGEC